MEYGVTPCDSKHIHQRILLINEPEPEPEPG